MADGQNKIALFIDADNIPAKYGKIIIETLQSRGEIFIRRIYGNWEKNSLHSWNESILKYGLLAVQQMDFAVGKNATDMSLTIDAMDVLYQRQATIFAIVSGDSDFTPLAVKLRERGVYVIGLSKEQASASFRSACNEFIELNSLEQNEVRAEENLTPQPSGETEKNISVQKKAEVKKTPAVKKITAATKLSVSSKKISAKTKKISVTSQDNNVKVELNRAVPAPVSKILSVASSLSIPSEKNSPAEKKSSTKKKMSLEERFNMCGRNGLKKPKKKLQQIHDVLHESAKAHADAKGFAPLNCAGHDLKQKNLGFGIKDFGYSLLNEFISDFPDLYELIRTKSGGRSFRYRVLE